MKNKKTIGDSVLDTILNFESVLSYKSFHKNHFPNPITEINCGVANWALFGVHAKLRSAV
jgi:hypothetical protein